MNSTDIVTINTLFKYVSVLEAQQSLVDIMVAQFPKMKQKNKTKTHRALHKQAYPEAHDSKVMNTKDAFKALMRG